MAFGLKKKKYKISTFATFSTTLSDNFQKKFKIFLKNFNNIKWKFPKNFNFIFLNYLVSDQLWTYGTHAKMLVSTLKCQVLWGDTNDEEVSHQSNLAYASK